MKEFSEKAMAAAMERFKLMISGCRTVESLNKNRICPKTKKEWLECGWAGAVALIVDGGFKEGLNTIANEDQIDEATRKFVRQAFPEETWIHKNASFFYNYSSLVKRKNERESII